MQKTGQTICILLQSQPVTDVRSHRLGGYFDLEKLSLPAQNGPRSMETSVAGPVGLHLQHKPEKKVQKG